MPIGTYAILSPAGDPIGTEEFRASAGPFGWRYVATIGTFPPEPRSATVDLTVDDRHRPVRIHIDTGAKRLLLAPEGNRLEGRRDGEPVETPWEEHLAYPSPCFPALTAARLGTSADVGVVSVEPRTLELQRERHRYELLAAEEVRTPVGRFPAHRWRVTVLPSGPSRTFWAAGLLVVAAEGLYELRTYEPGRTGPHPR